MDFVTILLGLVIVPAAFLGDTLLQLSVGSTIAVAMMITTVLAFSGSYPFRITPVNIGSIEGLVRGVCSALLLLAFGSIATRTMPHARWLVAVAIMIGLLVLQREMAYVVKKEPWQATYARSFDYGSDSGIIEDYSCYGELHNDNTAGHRLKRALDIAGSLIVLILALPLLAFVAVIIKMDSAGPVLIRQRRIGKNGVPFCMWKFRSMQADVCRYAPSPVSNADPRLTKIGRALRRCSFDELPQVVNVLQGNMSLVGPRPEMPFIVQKYDARERLRLRVMPGITGLWQISPARAMPIHQHLEFDFFYIENQNVFLDLAILLRTITAVFRGIGAT
jgi:lipopolysaccharide/colanic/teichoic acid biosynthesis glycosyltransferase